jgi:hypothetical protein
MRRVIWALLLGVIFPFAAGAPESLAAGHTAHSSTCSGACLVRYTGTGNTLGASESASSTFLTPSGFAVKWSVTACRRAQGFHLTLWSGKNGEVTALFVGGSGNSGRKTFRVATRQQWRPTVKSSCAWTFTVMKLPVKAPAATSNGVAAAASISPTASTATGSSPENTSTAVPPTATAVPSTPVPTSTPAPTSTPVPTHTPVVTTQATASAGAASAGGKVPAAAPSPTSTVSTLSPADTESSIDDVRTSFVASPGEVAAGDPVTVTGLFTNKGLPVAGVEMDTTWDFGGPLAHCTGVTDSRGVAVCSVDTRGAPVASTVRVYAQFYFNGKSYPQSTSFTTSGVITVPITIIATISSSYVHKGDTVTLSAHTSLGAFCATSVTYDAASPTYPSISSSFENLTDATWYTFTWVEPNQSTTAHVQVACTLNGQTVTRDFSYTVVP